MNGSKILMEKTGRERCTRTALCLHLQSCNPRLFLYISHNIDMYVKVSDDGKVMGMLGCTRAIGGTSFKVIKTTA